MTELPHKSIKNFSLIASETGDFTNKLQQLFPLRTFFFQLLSFCLLLLLLFRPYHPLSTRMKVFLTMYTLAYLPWDTSYIFTVGWELKELKSGALNYAAKRAVETLTWKIIIKNLRWGMPSRNRKFGCEINLIQLRHSES